MSEPLRLQLSLAPRALHRGRPPLLRPACVSSTEPPPSPLLVCCARVRKARESMSNRFGFRTVSNADQAFTESRWVGDSRRRQGVSGWDAHPPVTCRLVLLPARAGCVRVGGTPRRWVMAALASKALASPPQGRLRSAPPSVARTRRRTMASTPVRPRRLRFWARRSPRSSCLGALFGLVLASAFQFAAGGAARSRLPSGGAVWCGVQADQQAGVNDGSTQ